MTDYDGLMRQGHEAVGAGRFSDGLTAYNGAYDHAPFPSSQATALQGMGIALRLMGKLDDSERVLDNAREIAYQHSTLVARIERDVAMTILDRAIKLKDIGQLRRATGQFDDADAWLQQSWEALRVSDPIEAAATTGFIARLLFERGERKAAVTKFRCAHLALTGHHDVYELNNLVWLARASIADRWRFASRAFQLVSLTGDTRRTKEYLIILTGGNFLYSRLRNNRVKRLTR